MSRQGPLDTVNRLVKLRKQANPAPGEAFLRALASSRDDSRPPGPGRQGDSVLERRLLEAEQRAATAEAALQQIRSEAERRLADAREAIGREREARLAAERALVALQPAEPPVAEP